MKKRQQKLEVKKNKKTKQQQQTDEHSKTQ